MIILIGPSASGKTEIAKILIKEYGFQKFVTTTTRQMRVGEINDVDYHFISVEDFARYIKENKFIEYVNYNSNFYGTYKNEISNSKVLIVEPKGLSSFLALNDPNIISYYIDSPKDVREARMIARKDKLEDIKKRLALDDEYFESSKNCVNEIVYNDGSKSLDEIALKIYNSYKNKIKN
ncbi:MAG: hypothetical protein IJ186_04715 [Bacilli bacterium]|nr:hypothetical protein [Bacilli bacterium]